MQTYKIKFISSKIHSLFHGFLLHILLFRLAKRVESYGFRHTVGGIVFNPNRSLDRNEPNFDVFYLLFVSLCVSAGILLSAPSRRSPLRLCRDGKQPTRHKHIIRLKSNDRFGIKNYLFYYRFYSFCIPFGYVFGCFHYFCVMFQAVWPILNYRL